VGGKQLSYPAFLQSGNGDLATTFSFHRRAIAFVEIPLSEFTKKGPSDKD
jgi:hypothetical protein